VSRAPQVLPDQLSLNEHQELRALVQSGPIVVDESLLRPIRRHLIERGLLVLGPPRKSGLRQLSVSENGRRVAGMQYVRVKLARCVRGARDASRDYRETRDCRYLQIKREAMQDARYWRNTLRGETAEQAAQGAYTE
jgi:hypothetical protein